MKRFICAYIIFSIAALPLPALAGGAAARSKKQKGQVQQQRMIMQQRAIQQRQAQQQIQQRQFATQGIQIPQQQVVDESEVQQIVDIEDLWESLAQSSKAWPLIIDTEAKVATIARYIEFYRQNGVIIRRPPQHYVAVIDSMAQTDPEMLAQPFPTILRIVAVIEYDFDNGQDKDAMVYQILGKQGLIENRKRLGLPIE